MQEAVKNLVNTDYFKNMAQQGQDAIQQGISGIGQASGLLQGLSDKGITADNINKMAGELYDSELVKSSKESLGKDIEGGLNKSVQALNQQSAGSGSMGSSRAGVAQGVMTGEAADAYAQGSAAIENSARNQAMSQAIGTLQGNQSTALNAGQSLGSLGVGSLGQMGNVSNIYQQGLNNALTGAGILQQQQQGILNNNWFNAQGQQNAGWNNLNNYLGIAGSIGGMGGTSTTTGNNKQNFFGAMINAGANAAGSYFGAQSDRRLKDDIELVLAAHERKNNEGVVYPVPALYKWKWNEMALELFDKEGYKSIPPEFGCIAQELEETGFEKFVHHVDSAVGEIRVVDYVSLCLYVGLDEMNQMSKGE